MSELPHRLPRAAADRVALYRASGLWHNRCLADGIEAAAARHPDALAVADNDGRLSYAGLARALATAAAALAAHRVRAAGVVVLVSGNTRHGVIAYHALLRAGATVIALDRRCGAADLRTALDAVPGHRPSVIIAEAAAARLRDALTGHVVIPLEAFDGGPDQPPVSLKLPARPEPDRDRAAVLLFSSGTTGRPKGVLHSLNTLTAGAANMARITSAGQDTVCYLVAPLTSITGLMQVHLAADAHAALVLEDRFDPQESLQRMNAAGATLLGGAPVIAERLLHAAMAGPGPGLRLRTLALGGAMLPRPLLELATESFGIMIARVYGSSEAPNFTGSLPGDGREARLSDDGALMPGSEVRVGSSGHPREGMLRGPSVFLGYLDPADNASAFEGGWYRTGDQVEMSSAGNGQGRLTVVGRLKEVVNRNGLKISLPEADAALDGLPGVLECSSFGLPDEETGERLAVAVRLAGGASLTLADVAGYLLAKGVSRRNLPEQLVRWDGPLPRTASGKVVRSRLVMECPAKDGDLAPRCATQADAGSQADTAIQADPVTQAP